MGTEVTHPAAPGARRPAIVKFYDDQAAGYDEALVASPQDLGLRRHVQGRILEHLNPGDRVLDYGCGTGLDALELARAGLEVTGVDVSPGMLEQAQHRFAAQGEGPPPRFRLGGEEQLAVLREEGERFAAVLSNFAVLNTIEDPGPVLEAFAELTSSGSMVLVVAQNPLHWRSPLQPWWWRALPGGLRSGSLVHDSPHWGIRTFQHLPRRLLGHRLPLTLQSLASQWSDRVVSNWPRRLFGRFLVLEWIRD